MEVSSQGRAVVLTLYGELDVASSRQLEAELQRLDDSRSVVIDLRALEFVDSTGLGVLVKAHQRMDHTGGEFCMVQGGGQVKRLFDLTGLTEQLRFAPTVEQALGED